MPRAYEDRGQPIPAGEVASRVGAFAVVRGTVRSARLLRRRGRPPTLRAVLEDTSGSVSALWFHAAFLAKEVVSGRSMVWAGRVSADGVLLQPELAAVGEDEPAPARLVGIRAAYPLTDGVSQRFLWGLVEAALRGVPRIDDPLPESVRRCADVAPLDESIRAAHRPRTLEEAEWARERLLLDELLPLELEMKRRALARRERPAPRSDGRGGGSDAFARALPFRLSPSQVAAVEDVREDLDGAHPMARMLVGEVGSGKTAVALAAIEEARSRGLQCALLAPTELLARQHYRTAVELLTGEADRVVLLTGALSGPEGRRARERLASGAADVAIGTHALFSEATSFDSLGLVVIDEQHRFGVGQREALLAKAETPHCLVLTATPIPRSLALLAFGDMELSVLERRPGARGDVTTRVVPHRKRKAALDWVAARLAEGEQAFFVRPRIEGVDGAEDLWTELCGVLRGCRIELIHGRLPADVRDERLEAFRHGDAQGLVATTLIEVGLDVPGATILWVEGAERLGLAQIHQLRGRIARRGQKGYCWLVEGVDTADEPHERLGVLVDVDDGLRLAEIDLATRGPGELLGLRQSGRLGPFAGWGARAPAKLADLAERASRAADLILEEGAWPIPSRASPG